MLHRWLIPLACALLLASTSAHAQGSPPVQSAGGRVLQVLDPTHVVVSRGKAEGLRQDDASLTVHPVRSVPGTKTTVLEMTIRLARARVRKLEDHTATLELSLVTAPVQVGDYFDYVLQAPAELLDDPLFEMCLLDIHLRTLASDKPMATLGDLLAHPQPSFRAAIVQAMVQEIHAQAELAKSVLTDRIEGGRFHGQTLNQAFVVTNTADMLAFLDFVRAFPGKYIAHDWKLAEVYATWIINRTPTGEREAALKRMKPVLDRADRASTLGHFEEAEAAWREALQALPGDEGITKKLKSLEEIRTARETLVRDPDDTATRWKLMLRLYDREALDLALEQLTRLEKAGYEPDSCARYRGFIAVRRKEYAKAIAIFDALLAKNPKAPIAMWRDWAVNARQSEADPKSFEAAVGLARIAEAEKSWDTAVARYRDALDRARTPEDFATAKAGPERVATLREMQVQDGWIESDLERHDLAKARERMEIVDKLCTRVTVPRCVARRLGTWAATASSWWETGFAVELLEKQVAMEPRDEAARFALAWALLQQGHWQAARVATLAGLDLAPDNGYGRQILSRLDLQAGRLDEAQRHALVATRDKTYAWPLQVLARVAVLRGQWSDAVGFARKAHALLPDESDLQETQDAVLRGHAAILALAQGEPADEPRQRLRLVRALVALELPDLVTQETARISAGSDMWKAARQAVALSDSPAFSFADRAQAARDAGPVTPWQKRRLALLEAHAQGDRLRMARSLISESRFHEALVHLHDAKNGTAAADLVELARRGLHAQALRTQADDATKRQDFAGALKLLAQALAEFQAVQAPRGVSGVAFTMAWVTSRQGKHQEALAFVTPHLQAARDEGDELSALDLQRIQSYIEGQLGSLDSTRRSLETTRATCERLDRSYCLAQVTHDLAELAQNEGRLAQALELAEKARRLADDVGVVRLQRQAVVRLADIHLVSGDLPPCKALAEYLLVASRKDLDADNERSALMYLGAVALKRGDATTARARFAEVYDLGQRIGATHVRAVARLFEGAAVLDAAHDPKGALPLLLQAATLYASVDDREGQMSAWLKLGRVRSQLADLTGARQALEQARTLAVQLQREPFLAGVHTEVALLEAKAGRPDEAKAAAKEAVRIADRLEFSDDRWAAHHAMGRALEAAKDDAGAVAQYEQAIATVIAVLSHSGTDQEREGAFGYGRVRDVFRDAIDLLVRTGNVTRAMELLELSRDADLRRIFDTGRLHAQDGKLKKALSEMKTAEEQALAAKKALDDEMRKPADERSGARVEALSKVAAATDGELRQLLLRLKRDHRQIYALLAVNPESLSELRDSLPPDTLVVEYFIAADAVYAFVLSRDRDKPRAFKVAVPAGEVERAVFEWRKAIGGQGSVRGGKAAAKKSRGSAALGDDPQAADAEALSKKLYSWLIAPVEAEMAQAKTTLFVPFGPLYYLPMHALATTDSTGKLVYALEKYRIGYLSSTTIFRMLGKQRSHQKPTLLAFANPDGSLDGAQAEMERVRTDSFPEARLLIKAEATKKRFFELAGQFRIVHFATHGILASDALASHLKMAGEPLTVDEITGFEGLEGHTDLVVLSACETAIELGRSTGDEVISIASAFATAGAPALVASLWDVDDQATSELMVTFYAALKQGVDTLEALRQAQLHVLRLEQGGKRPFADPGYWAAFELIGDFR